MLEVIKHNYAATVATIGLCIYFFITAIVFILKPIKFAEQYSMRPKDEAQDGDTRVLRRHFICARAVSCDTRVRL